ncbi:MAG: IS4 family transposase [Bacteroidales bacterium]|nr:IS4 family transposase [Bacteroidales bacterium]
MWTRGIEAVGAAPEGCLWVDVCDRGGDAYEVMSASQKSGHHFLLRVCQDREVGTRKDLAEMVKFREFAEQLPSLGQSTVSIPSQGRRAVRKASVQLAASPIWIPAPKDYPQRISYPVIHAWVIRIWEVDAPADVEPLDWTLVTSVPTTTLEEAIERRDWYACRWMIEEFHRIEKSGCQEEGRRFETAARMLACLAILSLVAVRVFQLRAALDSVPNAARIIGCDEGGIGGIARPATDQEAH